MLNVYFQFFGLLDIILLTIVYFTKSTFKSTENKIYSMLIITSFAGQILHILSYLTIYNMEVIPITNWLVTKCYLIYLLVWISLIFIYMCLITYKYSNDKKNLSNINKTFGFVYIFDVIILILIFYLPTYCFREENIIYTYGASVNLMYLVSILYIALAILVFILHSKQITKTKLKKYLPLFVFILIGGITMMIQFSNPSLLLMTSCETFITFLMYFTIENPDLQMLSEFHKVKKIAEEANKEKNIFLLDISNQMKVPLQKINTIGKQVLMENDIYLAKDEINNIIKNSNDLLQILNNELDITNLESRKIEIRNNKYQPFNLFSGINKLTESKINSKKVKYRFHYDNSIPEYLYGDFIRLRQILNIILDNSVQYTKEGFIELDVKSVVKHDICRLIITIEDSGIGMTADEIHHLFDKNKIYSDEQLKTIDDTRNNLGMVKSLINLMNGSIMVNSEYGKGSTFTIICDQKIRKSEKTKVIEAVEKYEDVYINTKKILLVTNDSNLSKKIRKFLKPFGYQIEEANGGQFCLERLRNKEKFNLILIDENLEKLSSEDTLLKIQDTPGYKIPTVLLTEHSEFGSKEIYQKKGFTDIVAIPLKKENLYHIVEKYMED